jgi:hypothetical protein
MTVTHIVSFVFKDEVSKEERNKLYTDFLGLKELCKQSGEPYITELVGGKANISTEGAGKEFHVRCESSGCLW